MKKCLLFFLVTVGLFGQISQFPSSTGGGGSPVQNNLGNITGATVLISTANADQAYSGTLTGNVTFTATPTPTAGAFLSYSLTQDGSGNHTVTWPAGYSTVPPIFPGANCTTTALFRWDGSAAIYQSSASYCGAYIPETAAPTITPGSGFVIPWDDSTDHLEELKTSTGVIYKFVPYIDPTTMQYKDDFPDVRAGTSGNIGELGWGHGCTATELPSIQNHPGIENIAAGAVAGNVCVFRLFSGNNTPTGIVSNLNTLATNQTWEYLTVFQITSGAATTQTIKGGLGSNDADTGTTCTTNCIFWMFDPSVSANFQLLTVSGGTATTTGASTGAITVAINTWYQIRIFSTGSGTVQMEVKQGANTQTQSTASNVPSGAMTLYYTFKNNNTQPNIQLDYVHFRETNLARF